MATPGNTPASVITVAGLAAAAVAGSSGPLFDVIKFRFGSRSMAEGDTPTDLDTDVDDFVYEAPQVNILYNVINESTVNFVCQLGTDVGDFFIGNFGMFLSDGTLLAKVALPNRVPKAHAIPPAVMGDQRTFVITVCLSNVANIVNFALLDTTDCTLPQVPDETFLPLPGSALFNVYLCLNHTFLGVPALAARANTVWNFIPLRIPAGEGETVLSCQTTQFSSSDPVGYGKAVQLNLGTNKYDPYDATLPPIGLRKNSYQIVTVGIFTTGSAVTPNAIYYITSGGVLTTSAPGNVPIGWGLNSTQVWLDFSGRQFGSLGGGGAQLIGVGPATRFSQPSVPITWTTIYTQPASPTTNRGIVYSIRATSRQVAGGPAKAQARVLDASNALAPCVIANGNALALGQSVDILSKPIILLPGDVLQVQSDTASAIDMSANIGLSLDSTLTKVAIPNVNLAPTVAFSIPNGKSFALAGANAACTHATLTTAITIQLAGTVYVAFGQVIPNGGQVECAQFDYTVESTETILLNRGTAVGVDVYITGRLY